MPINPYDPHSTMGRIKNRKTQLEVCHCSRSVVCPVCGKWRNQRQFDFKYCICSFCAEKRLNSPLLGAKMVIDDLFLFDNWDQLGEDSNQYYDCVLQQDIGEFKKGEYVNTIVLDYGVGIATFYRGVSTSGDTTIVGEFDIEITLKTRNQETGTKKHG